MSAARKRLECAVYAATDSGYKCHLDGGRMAVLRLNPETGGTELAPLDTLTDAALSDLARKAGVQ